MIQHRRRAADNVLTPLWHMHLPCYLQSGLICSAMDKGWGNELGKVLGRFAYRARAYGFLATNVS